MSPWTMVLSSAFVVAIFLGFCVVDSEPMETTDDYRPFILGDQYAWYLDTYRKYPWAVGIYKETTNYPIKDFAAPKTFEFKCGGVWLTRTTILTSAECTFKQDVRDTLMYAGDFDRKSPIKFSMAHPAYSESNQKNNIAVLHIDERWPTGKPLLRNLHVAEGGIISTHDGVPNGAWPEFSPDFAELSDKAFDRKVEHDEVQCSIIAANKTEPYLTMMSSPTNFTSKKTCKNRLSNKKDNPQEVQRWSKKMATNMHLCTRNSTKGHKLCDAANGWFLGCIDNDKGGSFKLVGILFHKQKKCNNKPNVFTRVSKYTEWINDMLAMDRMDFLTNRYPQTSGGGPGGDP